MSRGSLELGTPENPFTKSTGRPVERQNKFCACSTCAIVTRCTPSFDFYTRGVERPGMPLECPYCLTYGKPSPGMGPRLANA